MDQESIHSPAMSDINEFALRGIRAEIERLEALERQLLQSARKGGQISVRTSGQRGAHVSSGRGGTVMGSGRAGGGNSEYLAAVPEKRKRKMSAAGRKAIGDAARRRWAKVRAEKTDAGTPKAKGGKKR
jgi:hypothetical protein